MGTRNLISVVFDKELKVAQYSQWDGYPSGQGVTILKFLRKFSLDKFKLKLKRVRFANETDQIEIDAFLKSIGCENEWVNMEQLEKFNAKYPYFSRDIGGKILEKIQKSKDKEILLKNSESFAGDGLFCEYAYVIDLDKNKFEIYSGFGKKPVGKKQRFAKYNGTSGNEYGPVGLLKIYKLDALPTVKQFLTDLKKHG